jgi:DNA-binding response OmpR family regulator
LAVAKVLLIDDEEIVRETLADFLINDGYSVEQAANGRSGLKFLEDTTYDLIILDVFMPELDGIELIQILATRSNQPPIITISGGGGILPPNWSIKMTEVFGVKHSLTKPIDMDMFLDAVRESLLPQQRDAGAG